MAEKGVEEQVLAMERLRFLTPFLPVVLYLTTKTPVKMALVLPNLVKPYQPV